MCKGEWEGGAACLHQGMTEDLVPIPVDEATFMTHCRRIIVTAGCPQYARTGVHCPVTYLTYEQMTEDMEETPRKYKFAPVIRKELPNGTIWMDYRCTICRARDNAKGR
jgi:hypothetical protein